MRPTLRSIGSALVAAVLASSCALFNDPVRSKATDGDPGQLLVESEGSYLQLSCAEHREAGGDVFVNEYQFSSLLRARSELCPLNRSPSGGWRTAEDISIDERTDVVHLTADLESHSYDLSMSWPVAPSLAVFCWELTDAESGRLGVGLYHYGPPHQFEEARRVNLRFNDGPLFGRDWYASSLEAEAIFLGSDDDVNRFISALETTDEEIGYDLEVHVEPGTSEASRVSFNVSGWERAVRPLLEECDVSQ